MDASSLDGENSGSEWISVSDLMAALMIVFLFIAIVYIRPLANERQKVREIAVAWQASETAIHDALVAEFEADLERWDATIEASTLMLRFRSPEILFESGKGSLKPRFERILDDFFPRYVAILEPYSEDIEEIRIEGHTSSDWGRLDERTAYFRNMELSQRRTRSVLEYVLRSGAFQTEPEWLVPRLTANGLSSSRILTDAAGNELGDDSRRVDFRIRTRTRTEIRRILETVHEY